MTTKTTLILGIGNTILSDDGVGIRIAQSIEERLKAFKALSSRKCRTEDIVVEEASTGGIILLEMMLGYDRVFLIDSIKTKSGEVGDIYRITPDAFKETLHASSAHDVSFTQALEIGEKTYPDKMPREIVIYAVEVNEIYEFGETMSPEVEKAVSKVVERVMNEIEIQVNNSSE